jgi:hypothetical protein
MKQRSAFCHCTRKLQLQNKYKNCSQIEFRQNVNDTWDNGRMKIIITDYRQDVLQLSFYRVTLIMIQIRKHNTKYKRAHLSPGPLPLHRSLKLKWNQELLILTYPRVGRILMVHLFPNLDRTHESERVQCPTKCQLLDVVEEEQNTRHVQTY